ncbi:MAG: peptidoglycan-binding protein, partial [Treponema sp.]|nr:peptidoglycan-binding protein [Treponema sp.]
MTCNDLLDKVYEYSGESSLPLPLRLQIWLHCLICPQCAQELERFRLAQDILQNDFLPPGADFADAVMARLEGLSQIDGELGTGGLYEEGVSLRRWVVTGLVLLFSLSSAFFGMDFVKVAAREGSSYLLPLGITIGAVLSCYGAIFIGSHVKELSER